MFKKTLLLIAALILTACAAVPNRPSFNQFATLSKNDQARYLYEVFSDPEWRIKLDAGYRASYRLKAEQKMDQDLQNLKLGLNTYYQQHGLHETGKLIAALNLKQFVWNWCCQDYYWNEVVRDPALLKSIPHIPAYHSNYANRGPEPQSYAFHNFPASNRKLMLLSKAFVSNFQKNVIAAGNNGNKQACAALQPSWNLNNEIADPLRGNYAKMPAELIASCRHVNSRFNELAGNIDRAQKIDFTESYNKYVARLTLAARQAVADCERQGIELPRHVSNSIMASIINAYSTSYITKDDVILRGRSIDSYNKHIYTQVEKTRVLDNGESLSIGRTPLATAIFARAVCR